MIWFLSVFIISVLIFYILFELDEFWIFIALIITAFLGGVWSFSFTSKHVNTEEYVVSEISLQSFTDSTSLTGQKFLFSGYVNEKLKLRYIISTQHGKQIEESDINNYTYIKESSEKEAKKITYGKRIINESHWYDWIIYTKFLVENDCTRIEFIVPKGTITNEYNIDLK